MFCECKCATRTPLNQTEKIYKRKNLVDDRENTSKSIFGKTHQIKIYVRCFTRYLKDDNTPFKRKYAFLSVDTVDRKYRKLFALCMCYHCTKKYIPAQILTYILYNYSNLFLFFRFTRVKCFIEFTRNTIMLEWNWQPIFIFNIWI